MENDLDIFVHGRPPQIKLIVIQTKTKVVVPLRVTIFGIIFLSFLLLSESHSFLPKEDVLSNGLEILGLASNSHTE